MPETSDTLFPPECVCGESTFPENAALVAEQELLQTCVGSTAGGSGLLSVVFPRDRRFGVVLKNDLKQRFSRQHRSRMSSGLEEEGAFRRKPVEKSSIKQLHPRSLRLAGTYTIDIDRGSFEFLANKRTLSVPHENREKIDSGKRAVFCCAV